MSMFGTKERNFGKALEKINTRVRQAMAI